MDEIINPYIAGAPVTEQRMFFGRDDIFEWIEKSLAGQYADHILVVHGQRRVGKTSVLKQLGNRLPKKYIPVFFDLQGRTHTTLDRFLWWLAREIARVLKQERGIETPLPEKDDFAKDPDHFENRFLPDLEPALGNSTLLLTFDEFDNLEESEVKEELARPLVDYLRRLMGQRGLNFIFSIGSSGRKLENMQAAYTEFFKTALYKKISFLNEEQTRGLVTRPVQGVIEYERAAVDRIYQIASGHPYFTQLTCHELFARCQRTEQRKIAKSDVEEILDDVVERGTVNLKFVWDEAADIEKWGLAALAQLDKPDPRAVADYLRKNRVRFTESDLTSGLLHLREKDVLTPDNRFVIHLLKLWLQKNRPIEQAREELTEVNPIANRYIEIGLEFKDARQYTKAIESFQEALAIAKDNVQAQVNIALTYMDQKLYDKAVLEFEKALAMDDEDVSARAGLCEAHLALGDSAMTRGRAKDATLSYQRVLTINAEHLEARGRMAELSRQRAEKALTDGKDEEALSAFAEALRFTPEDQSLIARAEKVRAEKKAKVLAALIARSEKEATARNWDKSLATLNEALELAPLDASIIAKIESVKARQLKDRLDGILARVDQAEKSGRWDTAISALGEYLALKPDDAAIQKRLDNLRAAKRSAWLGAIRARADAAVASERWDEAVAALNEVSSLEPENAEIAARVEEVRAAQKAAALRDILRRSMAAAQAGHWDEAIEALNAGLVIDPGNLTLQVKLDEARQGKREARLKAALRLADTAAQAGKWDSAVEALNEVLAVEPDNAEFQKKLSEVRAQERSSKLNAARTQARSLARAEKFEESLNAWDEYLRLGPDDRESAQAQIESVKKAQNLARNYAEAYKAYSKKNYEKAIGLFKAIVMEDADYKESSRLLAESVELRRTARKWWQSRWVLGGVGLVALVAVAWFVFRFGLPLLAASPTAAPMTTSAAGTSAPGAESATATLPPTVTPTPLPLAWARLNSGQFLSRADINSIALDPSDPGIIYVATEAGVYKSIDGGISWQPSQTDLERASVGPIIIDPQDPNTLFVGASERGIYKTSDGGKNWRLLYSAENPASYRIIMDPINPEHLYFTDGDFYNETKYLYFSRDSGETWDRMETPTCPSSFARLEIHPTVSNTLFISFTSYFETNECNLGMYVSEDDGQTWSFVPANVEDITRFVVIRIQAQPSEVIYASITIGQGGRQLYKSLDRGKNWTWILDKRCLALEIDPDNPERIYCGTIGDLMVTEDGGINWESVFSTNGWLMAIALSSDSIFIGEGLGNGFYASRDAGKTWNQQNSGMGASAFNLHVNFTNSANWYIHQEAGNPENLGSYRSSDEGQTWSLVENQGHYLAPGSDGTTLYRLGETGILRSTDAGATWVNLDTPMPDYILGISTLPQQPNTVFILNTNGYHVSTDGGETWDSSKENAWGQMPFDDNSTPRLYSDGTGKQLYVIGSNANTESLRSADGGKTWERCSPIDALFTYSSSNLAIDPSNNQRLIVATNKGVFISTDGCKSWQSINNRLGSPFVNSVAIDPNSPDTLYAGTDGGAYVSTDSGQTWNQINDGLLGATVVYSIVVDKDSNVYAATPYGIFKLEGK